MKASVILSLSLSLSLSRSLSLSTVESFKYFANTISQLLLPVDGAHVASCEEMATAMSSGEGATYKGLHQCIEMVMAEVYDIRWSDYSQLNKKQLIIIRLMMVLFFYHRPTKPARGRVNLLAEGCRGSLSEKIISKYNLREKRQAQHQTYALGIKEVWEIDESKHKPGSVIHTLGWPLDHNTYGGSFLYHMKDRQVSIGLVVALDYHNPFMSPYEEFQKLKNHPAIRTLLESGTVLQYGARTLNEGGFQVHYRYFLGALQRSQRKLKTYPKSIPRPETRSFAK